MGYSYDRTTGRLVCDHCGQADGTVRKRCCPHGWCPPPAYCKTCWNTPEIRQADKDHHIKNDCQGHAEASANRDAEEKQMLADGMRVRCSALSTDDGRVHVIFRCKSGDVGAFMKRETYRHYPLVENHTWEDYELIEGQPLQSAPANFY